MERIYDTDILECGGTKADRFFSGFGVVNENKRGCFFNQIVICDDGDFAICIDRICLSQCISSYTVVSKIKQVKK